MTSDCGAVTNVRNEHNYTKNVSDTILSVLEAGMDLECGTFLPDNWETALSDPLLAPRILKQARTNLEHLFSVRLRLGEFEQGGFPFGQIRDFAAEANANAQVALEAVHQGVVLLKNRDVAATGSFSNDTGTARTGSFSNEQGENPFSSRRSALPIILRDNLTIAVVGPMSWSYYSLVGNYAGVPRVMPESIYDGFQKTVSQTTNAKNLSNVAVLHAPGCLGGASVGNGLSISARLVGAAQCPDTSNFLLVDAAVEAADHVVLAVGIDETVEAEGLDREDLSLPTARTSSKRYHEYQLLMQRVFARNPTLVFSGGGWGGWGRGG